MFAREKKASAEKAFLFSRAEANYLKVQQLQPDLRLCKNIPCKVYALGDLPVLAKALCVTWVVSLVARGW